MQRWLILATLLLLPAASVRAESPGAMVFPSILGGYRSRMIALERTGEKADLKKAKAISRILVRSEKPRLTLLDEVKFGIRIEKAIRRRLADEEWIPGTLDWAIGELDRLSGESCEDAEFWADSLPPSRTLDRARRALGKARDAHLLADGAPDRKLRLRSLKKCCLNVKRAEKKLVRLGLRPDPVPVIRNPGFEIGTGTEPDGWMTWAAPENVTWVAGEDRCAGLEADSPAYQLVWYQSVRNLVPGRYYNVSARVRGEDIVIHQTDPGKKHGACLELLMKNRWRSDAGTAYQGTFDWKDISFTFRAEEETETIALRLGLQTHQASGRAWFDDVRISADDWADGPPQGDHVRLILEAEDLQTAGFTEDWMAGWIRHLDHVYEVYEDLVGGVPYNGAKIDIVSVRQYPGGWAVAGNPILWQRRYVPGVLEKFRLNDDWSFGILHEIGHDFDLDYRWVYQAEVQANFKMAYALEKLGGSVSQRGVLYTGGRIIDFYEIAFNEAKAAGEVTSWGGWLYRVLRIREEIGWEPFRKMYRSYPSGSRTRLEKFELFFDELERHAGRDIRGTLIPADELAWVRDQLD